jgi:hypothetical protein
MNPDSRGVSSRWPRLADSTSEAAKAATPRVAPKIAERTGTAVRPWPGCSAIRTPAATAGERQAHCATSGNASICASARPGSILPGNPR